MKNSRYRYYKNIIRSALIRKPSISSFELAEVLKVERKTAMKYLKMVKEENVKRMEKEVERLRTVTVEEEMAKLEKEMKEVVNDLWAVISAKNVNYKERVNALRAVIFARKELFNLKFDAGLFARSLGKVDIDMADLVKKVKEVTNGTGGNSSEGSL